MFQNAKQNISCSFLVVCDIRRDGDYFYSKDKGWLLNDFFNATHYHSLEDIPVFSVVVSFYKVHLIFEDITMEVK